MARHNSPRLSLEDARDDAGVEKVQVVVAVLVGRSSSILDFSPVRSKRRTTTSDPTSAKANKTSSRRIPPLIPRMSFRSATSNSLALSAVRAGSSRSFGVGRAMATSSKPAKAYVLPFPFSLIKLR